MQEWADFIKSVGFPVFVAMLLLLRVDAMHGENLKAIAALTEAVNMLRLVLQSGNAKAGGQQ